MAVHGTCQRDASVSFLLSVTVSIRRLLVVRVMACMIIAMLPVITMSAVGQMLLLGLVPGVTVTGT